jgi:hypothetical protein
MPVLWHSAPLTYHQRFHFYCTCLSWDFSYVGDLILSWAFRSHEDISFRNRGRQKMVRQLHAVLKRTRFISSRSYPFRVALTIILFGEEVITPKNKTNYVRLVLPISSMFRLPSPSCNQMHLHTSSCVTFYCSKLCALLFAVDFQLILYCSFPSSKSYWTWRKLCRHFCALILVIVCKYPHAFMTVFHYT